MHEDLHIQQESVQIGKHEWVWAVWLSGPTVVLDEVDNVTYLLHSTFATPRAIRRQRKTNFRLDGSGWGGFLIRAIVNFKDESQQRLQHMLTLVNEIRDQSPEPRVVISYAAGDGMIASNLAWHLIQKDIDAHVIDGGFDDPAEMTKNRGIGAIIPPKMSHWMEEGLESLAWYKGVSFAIIPKQGRDANRLKREVIDKTQKRDFSIFIIDEVAELAQVAEQIAGRIVGA